MGIKVVDVTPEIAAQWLSKNDGNRSLSALHVKRLADIIRRGEWVFNGETIVFSDGMRLLDGQHRLSAIVMSGTSQRMAVVTGISDDRAFQTYDSVQRARTPDQIAQMMGATGNFARLVATSKIIMFWNEATSADDFAAKYVGMTTIRSILPHEHAAAAVAIEPAYNDALSIVGSEYATKSVSFSATIAITMALIAVDRDATRGFWARVKGGAFIGSTDPCLHYRDRIMAQSRMKGRGRPINLEFMAVTIKAWNAFKAGQGMKILRWSDSEKFPTPIGHVFGGE